MIQSDHYEKADIRKRLDELELSWKALLTASSDKKEKLQDAHQVGYVLSLRYF